MAKITKIRVGITRSLPNYNSIRLEIEEDLDENEVLYDACVSLKNWINLSISRMLQEEKK